MPDAIMGSCRHEAISAVDDRPLSVLLLFPRSRMHGGGELVAAWIVQALKDEHSLSILAWEQLHLDEINRACGTALSARDYQLILPPAGVRRAGEMVGAIGLDPHRTNRYAYLMRMAHRLHAEHDVVVTAFDEADLGRRGIQYVHEPWTPLFLPLGATTPKQRHLRRLRNRAWVAFAGFSAERMRTNLTLVNSEFSARRVQRELGIRGQVLHPPPPGRAPHVPWAQRELAIVAVGRLVPAKRFDEIVEIVEIVRQAGVDLRLHIAGRPEAEAGAYLHRLRARINGASAWATLHENLPREDLLKLLSRVRYGIHAFREEPFGIAVAEMIKAGCVTFGHRSGGVVEILAADELLFSSPADAARRLLNVIRSPSEQDRLRAHLVARAEQYDAQAFVRRIRELVRDPSLALP